MDSSSSADIAIIGGFHLAHVKGLKEIVNTPSRPKIISFARTLPVDDAKATVSFAKRKYAFHLTDEGLRDGLRDEFRDLTRRPSFNQRCGLPETPHRLQLPSCSESPRESTQRSLAICTTAFHGAPAEFPTNAPRTSLFPRENAVAGELSLPGSRCISVRPL